MIELSLICPIYNCELYLSELLASIARGANGRHIEIVFVDDGSQDNSLDELRSALDSKSNQLQCYFQIIEQGKNTGLSFARNTGINAARGRYIGFLDADDVLLDGYADVLLEQLRNKDCPPVVEFGYAEFTDYNALRQSVAMSTRRPAAKDYPKNIAYRLLFANGFFCWSRIYHRKTFESVRFQVNGLAYEDIPFQLAVFAKAQRVRYLNIPLVGYRKRPNSITSIRNGRFTDQFIQLHTAMVQHSTDITGGMELQLRYVKKLVVVLLKGFKIEPQSQRLAFYRTVSDELQSQSQPLGLLLAKASRALSHALLLTSRAHGGPGQCNGA